MAVRIIRIILFLASIYILYNWITNDQSTTSIQQTNSEFNITNNSTQHLPDHVETESQSLLGFILMSPFKVIGTIFSFAWTLISFLFKGVWFLIKHIWLIKAIWVIFMSFINFAVILLTYHSLSRDHSLRKSLGFFPLLLLVVGMPLVINNYLVDENLARNIFLPLYLTLFVDIQGDRFPNQQKIPRNIVFFTLICAFL